MSLLAFQDIIMSVTGIIIVVVLLITLELMAHANNDNGLQAAATAELLRQEITTAEAIRDELQAAIQRVEQTAQQSAHSSPAVLRREMEEETTTIQQLEEVISVLTPKAQLLEKALQSLEAESFELQETRDELAAIRERIAQLEQQIAEEAKDNRTIFTLPKGIQKNGWLVVVSGRRISAAPFGRESVPVHFQSHAGERALADSFLTWADAFSVQSTYFLLLCRPDGSGPLVEVRAGLASRGIEYGYDLIGSKRIVLHPKRGTAP